MPVDINKVNKKITVSLNAKKHWSSKDMASLAANGSAIAVSGLSGVANLAVAFGGSLAFSFTQLFFGLSNKEIRDKISKTNDKYKRLKTSLTNEGYTFELEEPTGFNEFGLHTNKLSTFASVSVALLNLGIQAGAAASAVTADFSNYNHDETRNFCNDPERYQNQAIDDYCGKIHPSLFDYCTENACYVSYALFGLAIATSSAEQHFKRVHLERWCETLEETVQSLDKLQVEVEVEIERQNSAPMPIVQ